MSNHELKKKVIQSLNQAVSNGYDLKQWSAEEIARDLHEYDSDLEDIDVDLLLPHVKKWKSKQ